ncbi:MAG TPA: response regulator [Candidatus Nitrosocosmicus sp.]|nr:response regulator [Candidatus Nitrosocosmicus sp.]
MSLHISIMIVEDIWESAHLYRMYLARLGYDSIAFTNPLSALDHFRQNPRRYSLVILDWHMPNLNGLKLAKKLRELDTNVKILLISAYFMEDMIGGSEFTTAKISDTMSKPILFKELGPKVIQLSSTRDN